MLRRTAVLTLLLLNGLACSTRYSPRTPGMVAVVMDGGQLAYHKDGRTVSHGFAGGGLVDVVEDDPEAKAAAETYNARMTTGILLTIVGAACATAAVTFLALDASHRWDDKDDKGYDKMALGTSACALGTFIGGAAVIASGITYHYDAINIYNDRVRERQMPRGYTWHPSQMPPPSGAPPPPWLPAPQPPASPQPPAPVAPQSPPEAK